MFVGQDKEILVLAVYRYCRRQQDLYTKQCLRCALLGFTYPLDSSMPLDTRAQVCSAPENVQHGQSLVAKVHISSATYAKVCKSPANANFGAHDEPSCIHQVCMMFFSLSKSGYENAYFRCSTTRGKYYVISFYT